mgnify:CR=1 FL=1
MDPYRLPVIFSQFDIAEGDGMRFFSAHIDQVLYKGPLSDTCDVGHERAGRDGQDGTVHDELPFSRIKLHRGDLDMAMEAGFLEETGYIGLDGGDEVALFMVQDIAIPVRIGAIEPLMIRMDIGIFPSACAFLMVFHSISLVMVFLIFMGHQVHRIIITII